MHPSLPALDLPAAQSRSRRLTRLCGLLAACSALLVPLPHLGAQETAKPELKPFSKPEAPAATEKPAATAPANAGPVEAKGTLSVLVLGDSMSLCGFGKVLDSCFRKDPRFGPTFSYMACGTVPTSWISRPPFDKAKTVCGYWTIESDPESEKPKVEEDTYGMKKHAKPGSHPVPKVEELEDKHPPDILVIQNGNNLFDLFRDKKTVTPKLHASQIGRFVTPLIVEALKHSNTLRRIYWVGSPISGRASSEVQDFVWNQVKAASGGAITFIDSRPMLEYPFKHMEPDHEHFVGSQMDEWAEKVFAAIDQDLKANPLPTADDFHQKYLAAVAALDHPEKIERPTITVSATLEKKTEPLTVDQLKPYREAIVAYLYKVEKVIKGEYKEQEIMVVHPSHIDLKPTALDKWVVGKTYTLRLHTLEGSPWETVKPRDDTGNIDLSAYIRVEDDALYPNHP